MIYCPGEQLMSALTMTFAHTVSKSWCVFRKHPGSVQAALVNHCWLITAPSLHPLPPSLNSFTDISVFTSSVNSVGCSVYFRPEPIRQKRLPAAIIYKAERKVGSGDSTFSASAILKQAKVSPRKKCTTAPSWCRLVCCWSNFQYLFVCLFIYWRVVCCTLPVFEKLGLFLMIIFFWCSPCTIILIASLWFPSVSGENATLCIYAQ